MGSLKSSDKLVLSFQLVSMIKKKKKEEEGNQIQMRSK